MKIRLLTIIVFVVLLSVLFCGCGHLDKTNNQHGTSDVEITYFSDSDITDASSASSEKEEFTTESDEETSNEHVIASTSETVNPTESEADTELTEPHITKPNANSQGEPEVNFSDLR